MDIHHPPKIQPVATIEAGQEALSRADSKEARSVFEGVLQAEESPEAFEGLGIAAWWLEDDVIAIDVRKRAYRLYRPEEIDAVRREWWRRGRRWTISSAASTNEIFAQDAEPDEISCGPGDDVAHYNPAPTTGGEIPDTFLDDSCENIDDIVN
jgi:hypothetical protein